MLVVKLTPYLIVLPIYEEIKQLIRRVKVMPRQLHLTSHALQSLQLLRMRRDTTLQDHFCNICSDVQDFSIVFHQFKLYSKNSFDTHPA